MKKRRFLTGGLLILAIVLIALGAFLGEPEQVLQKAVSICLECVGIG